MRRPIILLFLATFAVVLILIACDKEETVTGPVDNVVPAAITDLSVAVLDSGRTVVLSFTATGDDSLTGTASRYDVRVSSKEITPANIDSAARLSAPIPKKSGETEAFNLDGLVRYRLYFVAVRVCDEAENCSQVSNSVPFRTSENPDARPPGHIIDLTTSDVTDSSIALNWTTPGDDDNTEKIAGYDIHYSADSAGLFQQDSRMSVPFIGPVGYPGAPESLIVHNLDSESEYFFSVTAFDEVGQRGAMSNIATETTLPDVEYVDSIPPTTIFDLRAIDSSVSSMTLAWTAPSDEGPTGRPAAYDIRYAQTYLIEHAWMSYDHIISPEPAEPGATQSVHIGGLDENADYFFGVRSIDGRGNWSYASNVVATNTLALVDTFPPSPITDLSAESSDVDRVTLIWTAPADPPGSEKVAQYNVYSSFEPITESNPGQVEAYDSPEPLDPGQTQTVTIHRITPNTKYYFAVRSLGAEGMLSEASNVVEHTFNALNLATIWTVKLGDDSQDYPKGIEATSDGGCVVLGTTDPQGSTDADVYLARIDSLGGLEWEQTYGTPGGEHAVAFKVTPSGYQFVANRSLLPGQPIRTWVVWLDQSGSITDELVLVNDSGVYATTAASIGGDEIAIGCRSGAGAFIVAVDPSGVTDTLLAADPPEPCQTDNFTAYGSVRVSNLEYDPSGLLGYEYRLERWEPHPNMSGFTCEPFTSWSIRRLELPGAERPNCLSSSVVGTFPSPYTDLLALGDDSWAVLESGNRIELCSGSSSGALIAPEGSYALGAWESDWILIGGANGDAIVAGYSTTDDRYLHVSVPYPNTQSPVAVTSGEDGSPFWVGTTISNPAHNDILVIKLSPLPSPQ